MLIATALIFAMVAFVAPGSSAAAQSIESSADPSGIDFVWEIGEGGRTFAVTAQNDYVYMGRGTQFTVVDVSDPSAPQDVGALWLPESIRMIDVVGQRAYVAAGSAGVYIIDVSDPAAPAELGVFKTSADATQVIVSGNYAYVVDWTSISFSHLRIVDITEPTDPQEVGTYVPQQDGSDLFEGIEEIDIAGGYAYVLTNSSQDEFSFSGSLRVVDISQPANPAELGSHLLLGAVQEVAVSGGYAYVGGNELRQIDVADPSNPTEVPLTFPNQEQVQDLTIVGDHLYVVQSSLSIVDISNPLQPVLLSEAADPDIGGQTVSVSDGHAFLAASVDGLLIADVSDPTAPSLLATFDTAKEVFNFVRDGDILYAVTRDGFWVLDISDPDNPVELVLSDEILPILLTEVNAMAVVNSRVIIHGGDSLWYVVDVADPGNPTFSTSYDNTDLQVINCCVSIVGHFIYISSNTRLTIWDVSDPLSPEKVGIYEGGAKLGTVAVSGEYAYLREGGDMSILDLSDPSSPEKVGAFDADVDLLDTIAVQGDFAYAIDRYGTLRVVNVAEVANPHEVARHGITYKVTPHANEQLVVYDIIASGNYLYVTFNESSEDLYVLNILEPAHPTDAGSYRTPVYLAQLEVDDETIYAASEWSGIVALRLSSDNAISGRVRHRNNQPVAGVTISIDTQLSATTNDDGRYTFAELPAGVYTLTPTGSELLFWPPQRTVAAPPSYNALDFTVLPPVSSIELTAGVSDTLVVTDTQDLATQMDFPAGAVSQSTTVVFTPTAASRAGTAFAGHAFHVAAFQGGSAQPDFAFNVPASVTIRYSDADVRLVSDESALALWQRTEDGWAEVTEACDAAGDQRLDLEQNTLEVALCGSGHFALFGPTERLHLPVIE